MTDAKDKTYSSFLYGFVEQLDDIHSFHSIGLKALRPCYQVSLQTEGATARSPLLLINKTCRQLTRVERRFISIMFQTWNTAFGVLEVKLAHMLDCLSRVQDFSLLTSSNFVCWQGKEKVKPTGSFLSLMLCFSMKSPRHSATWSNSCSRREREML